MEKRNLCHSGERERKNQSERRVVRELHQKVREQMGAREVSEKSSLICERILGAEWYEKSRLIYAYYPLGNEVDSRMLLERALLDGKTVALPSTDKGRFCVERDGAASDCRMEFFQITSLSQLCEGKFHVMEPARGCPMVAANAAVVFVPGVAFDRSGNRYGYGKGYYDRYFARFPDLYRVALCYENQMEDVLVALPTDERMDCICTESQMYVTGRGAIWA